jgi:hypothetical protein
MVGYSAVGRGSIETIIRQRTFSTFAKAQIVGGKTNAEITLNELAVYEMTVYT